MLQSFTETGKREFEDMQDRIEVKDITGNFETGDNDVIIFSDVASYVSDPDIAFSNLNKLLKVGGHLYLNNSIISNSTFRQEPRSWAPAGNGESITFFTEDGIKNILTKHGSEFENYGNWNKQQTSEMVFLKCKKVA